MEKDDRNSEEITRKNRNAKKKKNMEIITKKLEAKTKTVEARKKMKTIHKYEDKNKNERKR